MAVQLYLILCGSRSDTSRNTKPRSYCYRSFDSIFIGPIAIHFHVIYATVSEKTRYMSKIAIFHNVHYGADFVLFHAKIRFVQ